MATTADSPVQTRECPACLVGNLSWLLSQAYFALATELSAAFAPLDISLRDYQVLSAALGEARTQTGLADLVGLDKTTMVVTIDQLEAAGLAARRPSPTDRRARVIEVTDAGRRKVEEGLEVVERVQEAVLSTLPERDRTVFLESLGSLVHARLAKPVECSPPLRRRAPRG